MDEYAWLEAIKWIAGLRDYKTNNTPLFLKMEASNGHFGASGKFEACAEKALIYDFVLSTLGISASEAKTLEELK
ncbi:hypothetical protein ACFL17_00365 [Pseudomonadota bacterium]